MDLGESRDLAFGPPLPEELLERRPVRLIERELESVHTTVSVGVSGVGDGAANRAASTSPTRAYPVLAVSRMADPTVARTRETEVRSAPGEIASTSASHSERNRRGECRARIASSRRWLALGRSISDPSLATACTRRGSARL